MCFNKIPRLLAAFIAGVLVVSVSSAPSSLTNNLFSLQAENVKSIAINQTFSENSKTDVVKGNTLACAQQTAIYGASVDANVLLLGEASVVRVIMIDKAGNEYMIYEINSLLSENNSFSIRDACHETKLLNAINPASLRVDVLAAEIELQKVSFATTNPCKRGEMAALQKQIKEGQHQQRIDLYNKMIKLKGEEWIAGPTEISMKSYEEKKNYFLGGPNNPLPNTQGTEFYAGGVMPARTNAPPADIVMPKVSMFVDTFDWRNRHGATKSSSPYFNTGRYGNVNGWASKITNQRNCGSCYIFASVGEAETKFHLYYNQHLDIDLSEQHVGSCHDRYAGRMCNGGMPDKVSKWIVSDGIMGEDDFEYTAKNSTKCRDSSNSPKEHAFFDSYKYLKGNEVEDYEDLKGCIIKYGPVAGADLSISHAMTVVGYRYRNSKMTLIYKNSWGGSGDKGYMYKASPYSRSSWSAFDLTKPDALVSQVYTDADIRCVDLDKDGYYNWGIGPKPETCPEGCPDEIDCDDNNNELGPYVTESGVMTGECKEITVGTVLSKLANSGLSYNCFFNPLQRVAHIRFEAPSKAKTSINIYSLSGTLIKTLRAKEIEYGVKKAVWNSTNVAGLPVSKGIYICTISVDSGDSETNGSFKIAVSR